jgi:hypothetical protein
MKNLLSIFAFALLLAVAGCGEKEEVVPDQTIPNTHTPNPNDTLVKFTLYSKRVPYIWKRVVEGDWVQDTIKTNSAVRYEPFDADNYGYGYWVTMNLNGQPTDSLHIKGEYKGKSTEMSSLPGQSAAYVLLDDLEPTP